MPGQRDWAQWVGANRTVTIVVGGLGMVAVAFIDYITGAEISFSIFYLAPLFLIAFSGGRILGLASAACAALLWFLADTLAQPAFSWHLIWNAAVRLAFFVLFVTLFERLRQMLEEEKKLARVDLLTGLPNSRALFEAAGQAFSRCLRDQRPIAVAYIDCDGFKAVNDRCGHEVGDEVLRVVGQTLRRQLRGGDTLARLGGDEFCALLPDADREAAEFVANKLVHNLRLAMVEHGWAVTVSIGLAVYLSAPVPVSDAVNMADSLMYAAKAAGKNGFQVRVF
jgi:diguanylate cyclase (GGDEF)-like protein